VAGDPVFNETHPFLMESDFDGRQDWIAALDGLEALYPGWINPGPLWGVAHAAKGGKWVLELAGAAWRRVAWCSLFSMEGR
jgi:hypothetical protein